MSLMDRLNPAQYSFGQYGVCKSIVLIERSFGSPSLHTFITVALLTTLRTFAPKVLLNIKIIFLCYKEASKSKVQLLIQSGS